MVFEPSKMLIKQWSMEGFRFFFHLTRGISMHNVKQVNCYTNACDIFMSICKVCAYNQRNTWSLHDHLISKMEKKTALEGKKAHSESCLYVWTRAMPCFPTIKPDAVGYLDMKDAHKKHISMGYENQFRVLQASVQVLLTFSFQKQFFLWMKDEMKRIFGPTRYHVKSIQ